MTTTHVVQSAYAAVKRRDLDALLTIFSADCEFIDITEPGVMRGHEAFTDYMEMTWDAFPDFHPAEAIFTAQGDVVAAELILEGTHQGEFLGVEPSGSTVRWPAAAFYTIDPARNQIVREVFYYDAGTLRTALVAAAPQRD